MKKLFLSLVLCFCMLLSVVYVSTPVLTVESAYTPNILEYEAYTSSNEYTITSYAGMVKFSSLAAKTNFSGKTVYLGCDVNMTEGVYTPFSSFAGTFDGQGYALKNLKISASDMSAGLFGTITATGTVKNLGMDGGTITLNSASDSHRVGSIAGVVRGRIERCYSTATVTIKASGAVTDLSVGGIAGGSISGGVIKDCYFAGVAKGVDHASGISDWCQGHNEGYVGQIINCYSIGTLTATDCYGLGRYSSSILASNYANAVKNSYYLSDYQGLSFTEEDTAINHYMLTSGNLAYLLDGGGTASTRTRTWHQGELFPELSGETKIGTYKLSMTFTGSSTATQTMYRNAGSTYSVDCVEATLTSAGNVSNNLFTMPAQNASLTVNTSVPNISDYSANSSSTKFIVVNSNGITALANLVNGGTDTFSGNSIYMLCDINMNSVSNHTPIGVYISDNDRSKTFQGNFYGNGNMVHALKVNKSSLNGAGLFGTLYKAKIYGLGIGGGYVTSANRAGGIAGYADASEFHECYNTASITTLTGNDGVGGLAGVSRSSTKYYNCFNIGKVTANADCAGGITGWGQTTVMLTSCFNFGKVTAGGGTVQGLTRFASEGLSTTPVACYYLKENGASSYGGDRNRNSFAIGTVAWYLNTRSNTVSNTGLFTLTPLCPALRNSNTIASSPAVRIKLNVYDSDDNLIESCYVYCNAGDRIAPTVGGYSFFTDEGIIAPNTDKTIKITMKTTQIGTLNIGTAAEFNTFMNAVNSGTNYGGYKIYLTADINMSSYTCKPIGSEAKPFCGYFDGQGFTVSGFNVTGKASYNALFGVLDGGSVRNLYLTNSTIQGGHYSAALVGKNNGGNVICCGSDADIDVYYLASAQELSVMSFNVRVNSDPSPNTVSERASRVKQHIADYSPDIIGFQEVVPLWKTNFDSWLTSYSKEFVWRDSGNSEAAPLYWKTSEFTCLEKGTFWLSETPDKASKGWDAAHYRTCSYAALVHKSSGILVLAFNTHLDNQSATAREKGAALIVERMKALENKYKDKGYGENIAMYCTGDYNCGRTSAPHGVMEAAFADLRVDANTALSSATQATYNGWGNSNSLIDYIFTNNRGSESLTYKVNNELISGKYISDHYAIFGTFGLNYMHAGGLVGYNNGFVSNCFTTGSVIGGMNTGGIVGRNDGTVRYCYNAATLDSTDYMGGIVGINDGTVKNCSYLENKSYVGDIEGKVTSTAMSKNEIASKAMATDLCAGGNNWTSSEGINGGYPFPAPLFNNKALFIKAGSSYTRTDSDYLFEVIYLTDCGTLTANFVNTEITVKDGAGNTLNSAAKVGTGYTVNLISGGNTVDSVTIVVRGDVDGDSAITTTDYALCKPHLCGNKKYSGLVFAAADITGDGIISSTDLLNLKNYIEN